MGQLSQGSGLSGNTVRVTAALFVGVLFRKCLQSHGTRLGFGLGTLTGESCLKNVHCHTDRASWDAILVTVVAFGALMWKKCAQSHSFGLGRVGGGIPLGGGGSANREPGSYIRHQNLQARRCLVSRSRDSQMPFGDPRRSEDRSPTSLSAPFGLRSHNSEWRVFGITCRILGRAFPLHYPLCLDTG